MMLEKMKFEKKEKKKNAWRQGMIQILGFILAIGYAVIFYYFLSLLDVTTVIIIVAIFGILSIAMVGFSGICLCSIIEEHMEENISEFNFNAKVDEFLSFLEDKEIQLELKLGFEDVPENFKNSTGNLERRYYVRKKGPKTLHIWVCEGNEDEEKWPYDTEDYDFFFRYFEPIYTTEEEKKEEA